MLQTDDLINAKFKDGGRGPEVFDCWGLAQEVFRRHNINLPDYKIGCHAEADIDQQINTDRNKWVRHTGKIPVPALIVFCERGLCDHVGVYIGGGKFIHAHPKTGISITSLDHPFWKNCVEGFYTPGVMI